MKYYILDVETYSEKKDLDESFKEYADKIDLNYNDIKDKKIIFGLCVMKELNKDNIYIFEDKDRLKEFILTEKHDSVVYIGHNIFNFDINVIFSPKEIIDNFDITFNGSTILKMRVKNKNIYFFDTYNIYKTSLKHLGELLGIEKGNLQKELSVMLKDEFEQRKSEIIEYCKRDVEITEKVFSYYLNELKKIKEIKSVKSINFTASSYSFAYFNYLNDNLIDGRNIDNDSLFLETYFGGRVENIYSGLYDKEIYIYDVNSLFPFVMRDYLYPVKFIGEYYNRDIDENMLKLSEGIALAKIEASKGLFGFEYGNRFIDIGLLPIKYKIDKDIKLIFPIGSFIGFFNINELRYAVDKGYNVKIYYLQLWDKGKIPKIKQFVDHFYLLKQNKKDSIEGFNAKLILNSLYGKFGQNSGYEKLLSLNDYLKNQDQYRDCEITYIDNFNFVLVRDNKIQKSRSSYFNIASYISSWARIYLLQLMEKFIEKGGYIFYMDTDSLFTNIIIDDKYIIGNELGKMKLDKTSKFIKIFGLKQYILDNEVKIKGVPKNAILINDNNTEMVFRYNNIIKTKSYLRSNGLYERNMIKTIKLTYKRDKGLNDFLDALNINSNTIYIKKNENELKINDILKKVNLKDIKVII